MSSLEILAIKYSYTLSSGGLHDFAFFSSGERTISWCRLLLKVAIKMVGNIYFNGTCCEFFMNSVFEYFVIRSYSKSNARFFDPE